MPYYQYYQENSQVAQESYQLPGHDNHEDCHNSKDGWEESQYGPQACKEDQVVQEGQQVGHNTFLDVSASQ